MSDYGASYGDCGNVTIHRTETRTNITLNRLTLVSNGTLTLNVTSDDLVLNNAQLYGNINLTNLVNLSLSSSSVLNATGRGNPNGTFEGKGGDASIGGGGGYGGIGGDSESLGRQSGPQYGDPLAPNLFGSPGGSSPTKPGTRG